MAKSLYKILGVDENASASEIKKAYRKLANKYHPDKNSDPDATEKIKEINAAYEVLGNAEKKAQYDMRGDSMFNQGSGQGFHQYHQTSGMDFDDILKTMFGFGGMGGFGSGSQKQNLDLNSRMEIPLSTAVNGGQIDISVHGEKVRLNIPKGIRQGTKMRLAGKGRTSNGVHGDLYITLLIQSEGDFILHGNDIVLNKTIDLKTAIFGGEINIDYFGEKIDINIQKNTKFGQKLRLHRGLNGGVTYININIELPKAELRPDLEQVL